MAKTVMVTGSTGYLGASVVDRLLLRGDQVRLFVRARARVPAAWAGRIEIAEGDLADPASVVAAAQGASAILHLAGIAADWVPDDAVFERVNVDGTRHVVEAALGAGVSKLLVTSSVMVLGPTDGLLVGDERTRSPQGPSILAYQRTKRRGLELARAARGKGLDVRVVFPGALFGPGPLTDGNYLARVMQQIQSGGYPVLPQTKGARWCLAHVDDVAQGHLLALDREARNGEHILGGDNVSFDRMLGIIQDELALPRLPPKVPGGVMLFGLRWLGVWHGFFGSRPPISFEGGRALLRDWAFSSEKAVEELGYRIRPFEPAFREFVHWFKESAGPMPKMPKIAAGSAVSTES